MFAPRNKVETMIIGNDAGSRIADQDTSRHSWNSNN